MSEPVRMCVGCRTRKSKYKLLRFVEKEGRLFFDPLYKAPGRSVSVCPSILCFRKALKPSVLERALRCKLQSIPSPESLREEVLSVLRDLIVNYVRMGVKFRGVVLGRDTVLRAKDRLFLLVLAEDLSENSLREISGISSCVIRFGTKYFWGEALNRRPVGIIGFIDRGLAGKVKGILEKYRALKGEV